MNKALVTKRVVFESYEGTKCSEQMTKRTMNLLILITNTYPYGQRETFVHNELPAMTEAFDHVILLPVYGHSVEANSLQEETDIEVIPGECEDVGRLQQLLGMRFRSIKEGLGQVTHPKRLARLFTIIHFDAIAKQSQMAQKRIVERVSDLRPSQIVIYSYWFYTHALVAVDLKQRLKKLCSAITCVSRAHGFDLYNERSSIGYLPYRAYLLTHLNHLFCCSQQGTEYLRKRYPAFAEKITTAHLGVPDYWSGVISSRKKPFHVVTCSRSVPVKRLDLWIRALATIQDISIKWTHIGDGEEQAKLKVLAADILPSNVEAVFRGEVDNHEITELYNTGCVNLIVNTSSSEGLPVSLMETFACAIPAVASNVGGVSEIIDDGKNGFLFSEDSSPDEIASKVRKIISMDEQEYMAFCHAARRKYEQCFNDEVNYRQFYEVINSLSNEWK